MTLMPGFRYHHPASVAEAVRLYGEIPGSRLLGGGTDLLVNLRHGLGEPPALIDVSAIAELSGIAEGDDGVSIGAAVTLADLAADPLITARYPALAEAALAVAGPTHRASATLGGNLCQDTRCVFYNQSDWWRSANGYCLKYGGGSRCHVVAKSDRCYATYHGDVAPVLMALGAVATIVGPNGRRQPPVAELYRQNGASYLTLEAGEMVVNVRVPLPAGWLTGYAKVRIRDAVDFPLAGVAASLHRNGGHLAGMRVAVTGSASAPLLVATDDLIGKAWDKTTADALAVTMRQTVLVLRTTVTGAKYRRRVLMASAKRLIDGLWEQAG